MTEPLLARDSSLQNPSYSTSNGTPEMATAPAPKTYPGQDDRQTSKREILAWYSYCFASEVYAVVSLSILPLPPCD